MHLVRSVGVGTKTQRPQFTQGCLLSSVVNSWKALLIHRLTCLCRHMGLGLFNRVKTWRTQRWHRIIWFYFWFCLSPWKKILVFCALSYLQHSYAPFNMPEIVWFSVFIWGSCAITKGQEGSFCSSKKFLSLFAWSSNICIPGKVSKVHIQGLWVKDNSTARNSGSANYYLEFGYFLFASF